MEASSDLPLAAEPFPAVLLADPEQLVCLNRGCPHEVIDEEFPSDLPVSYDWMLQPASRRTPRRALGLVAVAVVVLLILVSVYLVHKLPRPFPSISSLPSSSS
jgi:hypothetical protein